MNCGSGVIDDVPSLDIRKSRRPRGVGRLRLGLVFFTRFTLAAIVALVGALHDLR
jgi:hypothetical protein